MTAQAISRNVALGNINEFSSDLNILVAEDNVMIQELIGLILDSADCHLFMAENGRKALEILERNQVDLILMDLEMPEMNGFEATARIRAKETETGAHIPILAMTGYVLENGREKCMNAGMDDFLVKPFNISDLLNAIQRLTDTKLYPVL